MELVPTQAVPAASAQSPFRVEPASPVPDDATSERVDPSAAAPAPSPGPTWHGHQHSYGRGPQSHHRQQGSANVTVRKGPRPGDVVLGLLEHDRRSLRHLRERHRRRPRVPGCRPGPRRRARRTPPARRPRRRDLGRHAADASADQTGRRTTYAVRRGRRAPPDGIRLGSTGRAAWPGEPRRSSQRGREVRYRPGAVDPDVRPQDDLFPHVNGPWLDDHRDPGGPGRYGTFDVLRETAEEHVRAIVEEVAAGAPEAGHGAAQGRRPVRSFMDDGAPSRRSASRRSPTTSRGSRRSTDAG